MWFTSKSKSDYRIEERFVPEANDVVFKVQHFDHHCSSWINVQSCSTLQIARDMVEKYKKADNPIYHAA